MDHTLTLPSDEFINLLSRLNPSQYPTLVCVYQIERVSHYDAFSVPTMSQSHFIDQDANTVRGEG